MDEGFDKNTYEQLANEIFPGLTMYVRDVNLSPVCAEQYKPNMIIMERGFTDASCRVMGMVTTHRFAILSNHMADFTRFEHGTNWGLYVAQRNAHFKVLDVYEYEGHTQILLLHLPDDNRWKLFNNIKFNLEEQFVKDSRKRFENKSVQNPVPELSGKDWLDRCAAPLGINSEGKLFSLDPLLENELTPVKNSSFRDFYHRFVYLDCRHILDEIMKEDLSPDDTGAIAYGYIDETAGMSFHIFKPASLKNNKITMHRRNEKAMYLIRLGALKDDNYIDLKYTDINTGAPDFKDFEKMIRQGYDTKNAEKEKLRSFAFLDAFRDPENPDDIQVIIFHDQLKPEQVWVRGNAIRDNKIYGELLNEPNADFGVHQGDAIQIVPYQKENGEILCISPL